MPDSCQGDGQAARAPVRDAVPQRLLGDPEEAHRDVLVDVGRDGFDREGDLHAVMLRHFGAVRSQGRRQPEESQRRGMQILRQPSKPLEHLLGVGFERRQGLLRLPVLELSRRVLERADPHRHEDELLAHVVVQVLGDAGPRRLLRVDEPSGHLLNPVVARSKRRLPGAYRLLREAQPRSLPEQSGDEHGLHHDHRQRSDDDVPVIHVPDRRGDEADVGSRGQRGTSMFQRRS